MVFFVKYAQGKFFHMEKGVFPRGEKRTLFSGWVDFFPDTCYNVKKQTYKGRENEAIFSVTARLPSRNVFRLL